MTPAWTTIVTALITALIGGIGIAVVTYLLNRKRLAAETAKLIAETDKIRAEMRALTTTVAASLPQPTTSYVFDGRGRIIEGFDVSFKEECIHDANGKPVSGWARGTLWREAGGILNVQRSNTEGRLELLLKSYSFGRKWYPHIPQDATIAGKRRLLVECDAKTIGTDHTLRFVVKDPKGGSWLAEYKTTVSGNSWIHLTGLLETDSTMDYIL
jgi:hypothetical protein